MQKRMSGAKGELDAQMKAMNAAKNQIKRLEDKMKKAKDSKTAVKYEKEIAIQKEKMALAETEYKQKKTAYNKITQEKVKAVEAREAKEAADKKANDLAEKTRQAAKFTERYTSLQNQKKAF